MLWGGMPRAVSSSDEEILSYLSTKIKKKKALKETELQYTGAMTSLTCLKYSAKTHLLVALLILLLLGNNSVKVTETTDVQTPIPPSPALRKIPSNDNLSRVALKTHPST